MVGGGSGGSAVAAKMTSVLGKGNVVILDAADVYNFIAFLYKILLRFSFTFNRNTTISQCLQ